MLQSVPKWGRLLTCGRLSIGLAPPTEFGAPKRRIANPPQDAILPHIGTTYVERS